MAALHYLNLGHESAIITQSPYYVPPKNVRQMMENLSFLPAWYGDAVDKVLIAHPLDTAFIDTIAPFKAILAHPIVLANNNELSSNELEDLKATPWGLSLQSLNFFDKLKIKHGLSMVIPKWNADYYLLCSRKTAAACLEGILNHMNKSIEREIIPIFCSTLDEVERYISTHSSPQLLAKAPYSSSGRGLLWINNKELTADKKQWISGILKKQGYIGLEPALNKQLDFAMEFYADGKGNVNYMGLSLFNTATQGGYTGSFVGEQSKIIQTLALWTDKNTLNNVRVEIEYALKQTYAATYQGYLGVDMMIYKTTEGSYKIHPCVEINMRYTMGLVALRLSEKVVQIGCIGQLKISYFRKQGEALTEHLEMKKQHPAQFKADKICAGYLSLCPVDKDTYYCATLLISNVSD